MCWKDSFLNACVAYFRLGEPAVVAVLVLAEPGDTAILVEVRPGGTPAPWSGLAGAAGLSPNALDTRRSCRVAPQHHTSPFPFLQVCLRGVELKRLLRCWATHRCHFVFSSLQFSDRRQPLPAKHGEDGRQSGVGWACCASITPTPLHTSSQGNWTSRHRPSAAYQMTSPRLPSCLHFSFFPIIFSRIFFCLWKVERCLLCLPCNAPLFLRHNGEPGCSVFGPSSGVVGTPLIQYLTVGGSRQLCAGTMSLLWSVQQVLIHLCQHKEVPLSGEGSTPVDCSRERGKGVYVWRLFSLTELFFCHHTVYFCASVVCTAAFVSLWLPWFFSFIFYFFFLPFVLCSLGILLDRLILDLDEICPLIIRWKCIIHLDCLLVWEEEKKWEQETVNGAHFIQIQFVLVVKLVASLCPDECEWE